jgi:hypothetical protein
MKLLKDLHGRRARNNTNICSLGVGKKNTNILENETIEDNKIL